jgi:hypothetical protein
MKKLLNLLGLMPLFVLCFTSSLHAADLVVAPGGSGGSYASLNAALTAANAGDRIIVYPHAGSGSYTETAITITKSIQILSANEGAYFGVDAPSLTIAPATAGASITIMGLRLFTASITATAAAPAGSRCTVNIIHDSIAQGNITFDQNNFDVTVGSSYVTGSTTLRYGRVLGNIVTNTITVNSDATPSNDTVVIVGNRIDLYSTQNGIQWNSTANYFGIYNNYIGCNYNSAATNTGINIATAKNSLSGSNAIINNTINKPAGSYYYAIYATNPVNSFTEIQNNLIFGNIYFGGILVGSGTFSVHYNQMSSFHIGGFINDGTNIQATNLSLNTLGVVTNALSSTINGGNPDLAYSDINLSRNDIGCYGGSFTHDNYFPITSNDWARVLLVNAPRRVMVNSTIQVKALGFDK